MEYRAALRCPVFHDVVDDSLCSIMPCDQGSDFAGTVGHGNQSDVAAPAIRDGRRQDHRNADAVG